LECSLSAAQKRLAIEENGTVPCTPWYYPFSEDEGHVLCDPWQNLKIRQFMAQVFLTTECQHCLPDCVSTKYKHFISTEKFRNCDEKNFGQTSLCNLNSSDPLYPPIWGDQALQQCKNSTPEQCHLADVESNIREMEYSDGQLHIFRFVREVPVIKKALKVFCLFVR
jgi:hypothetical protein